MFSTIFALLVFLFPLAYSPGPGNMFFAANGARFGVRATLGANIGYHVATWGVTVAMGYGLSVALGGSPWVFMAVKVAGATYVLWIAWRMFHAPLSDLAVDAKRIGAWDGVVLLLLNPKAYVIIALMFSQFLGAGKDGGGVLLIATVFTANNFVAFYVWGSIGDTLARWFRDETQGVWLNRFFGVMLAGVAVWMLVI